jgi:two-component system, OmpR family, alkaline phosphatase synthesis response regulator PhoP
MSPIRILIIGDVESDSICLQQILVFEGYFADVVFSINQALEKNIVSYNIIIVDLSSGALQVYRMIKQMQISHHTTDIPVLFVAKIGVENSLLNGLDAFGQTFIYKPFDRNSVMSIVEKAILNSQMRLDSDSNEGVFSFKTLSLSTKSKRVTINQCPISLTKKEFELLSLFLQNKNQLFSRKELLTSIWSSEFSVSDRTIDVNIARLRDKLGIYKGNIVTRLGFGYGFEE